MRPSRRLIPATTLMLMTALAGPAQAQTSDTERIRELEKKLERSLELIQQLSSKISQIEQAGTSARAAQGNDTQQAAKIEALEKHVNELGGAMSRRPADEGLPVHGFADVGIAKSGENNATFKGRKGAALGTFDLYLTPQFGDRVRSLIELGIETNENGQTSTDVERMQIGYIFNDAATAWLGRFHTPFGYWNTAFHHGMQIQTSVLRPRFLEFEDKGGILPAHTTGIWLTGAWGTQNGKVGYDLFAGNAPQINGVTAGSNLSTINTTSFSAAVLRGGYAGSGDLDMRQSGSTSHKSSVGFNAWLEPHAVDGLRVGLHGLRADVIDDATLANRSLLKMLGGYFAYTAEPWEAIGEYYKFGNDDLSGSTGTHHSWAGFAQVGYNRGKWTPYGRFERSKLDQTDNYFGVQASGRSYRRVAAGLRYEVNPKAALKAELNSTRKEDLGTTSDRYPEFRMQYAIRF